MSDSIVACSNNRCFLDAFVVNPRQPVRCPACNKPLTELPYIPILHFYRPQGGRKGHFQNDQGYLMVGWHGRTLHTWHASPSQFPGPGIDQNPKAVLEFDPRRAKWYLRNVDLPDMRVLDGVSGHQDISPGQQVELADGARLILGPPDQCRLAFVQMLKLP
jgi:hypothetical protein